MKKISYFAILATTAMCVSCTSKSYSITSYRTTMEFHDNFRVMQLTDLHLGYEGDVNKQLSFIEKSILHANPDLIVLTGDSFMYGNTNIVNNLFNKLNKVCDVLSSTNENITKFAFTFGNHDNQGDYDKFYINDTIKKFVAPDGNERQLKKYAAFLDYNDDDLFGYTNYFIDLIDPSTKDKEFSSQDVKYRLHIIDSNSYHFTGIKYGYDVIHDDQLEHAKRIYNESVDKDYLGLAFFHIPFAEFEEAVNQYKNSANPEQIGQGEFGEGVSDPYENNGSYQKLKDANIQAFFVGHDHVNYCDIIYNAESSDVNDKAIFSYGVKSTEMIYHDDEMLGYKLINLKDNVTKEEFLNINYVKENFINVLDRGVQYE